MTLTLVKNSPAALITATRATPNPDALTIGITGTREVLPTAQRNSLESLMMHMTREMSEAREVHHGCCLGADQTAHFIAREMTATGIYGHPGHGPHGESPFQMDMQTGDFAGIYPALPYGQRNMDIVMISDTVIACPAWPETDQRSRRSGTWQTVRYARRALKLVILVIPDGTVIYERVRAPA